MITRTEAERVALAIHTVRTDWPVASLLTLIVRDLSDWPLLDLFVGLAHVAAEQHVDGTWVSQTPARVKENGPWRHVGVTDPDAQAYQARQKRELEERRADREARWAAVKACELCDVRGYLPGGYVCVHDPTAQDRAQGGARLAADALTQSRRTPEVDR